MKKLVLTLFFLTAATNVFATQETPKHRPDTIGEKLVGSFVKTFAKTYIATHNLEKFKAKNIKKINKMDEAKLQRRIKI